MFVHLRAFTRVSDIFVDSIYRLEPQFEDHADRDFITTRTMT